MMLSSANQILPTGSIILSLRMCLLGLALCTLSYLYSSNEPIAELEGKTLFVILAILFGFCAISGFSLLHQKTNNILNFSELLIDSAVITGIIYITGGALSPLIFLYLPFLLIVTIVNGRNTATAIAGASILLYSGLLYALNINYLSAFSDNQINNLGADALVPHLIGLAAAMFILVLSVDSLTKKIHQSNFKALNNLIKMKSLQEQQEKLFDEIPTGIILLDGENKVLQLNKTALRILGSYKRNIVGTLFNDIWETLTGTEWHNWNQTLTSKPSAEISYCDATTKRTVYLILAQKRLFQESSNSVGNLLLIQDVTQLRELESQLAAQDQVNETLRQPSMPSLLRSSQLSKFIAESPTMKEVLKTIKKLTSSDTNVLITGESGTGKELIAKALHYEGVLANKPFIAVNCGAIPADLMESQFFGHKKGAFTGAVSDQSGFFQQANGGTIFLDEIGELPLHLQSKLLRVIQERTARPVGAEKDIEVNVRIIAATNKNLADEVLQGNFREDLLYRINVVNIALPPLRERKQDIPHLVKSILTRLTNGSGKIPSITAAASKLLLDYNYPGNIRELENILERAYVFNSELITPENLRIELQKNDLGETNLLELDNLMLPTNLEEILNSIERRYLEAAIQQSLGSKKGAAELLGINFRSIRYRLDKYGIDNESSNS